MEPGERPRTSTVTPACARARRYAVREAREPVSEGVTVKMLEDTEAVRRVVLPLPPPQGGLTDAALEEVAGGSHRPHANYMPHPPKPNEIP